MLTPKRGAPFFFTNAGYGVYIDTLAMGLFNFSTPGSTRFVFNTTSLTVYVILPTAPHDYKSILSQHIALSAPISLPPDSAYGPILFSDDWNTDFHNTVSTATENYLDVASHLHTHRIRATALFADRPYGTGNGSWGNFDFNATAYPNPTALIATLASLGLDFQVWVANRAPPGTLLSNASTTAPHDWLFDIDPATIQGGLPGPALNLSIPPASAFFAQHLRAFTDAGVRGYKIDRGEEGEMPPWAQNVQSTLFLALCHSSMAAAYGENGAFFNFARNVVGRGRRHAAVWNGDAHANFTGLAYSVASGIRAGLLGFAMWGSDAGGYVRGGPGEPGEELWARWMHVAAWSPMYEIMVGTGATPWYAPYGRGLVDVFRDTAAAHHGLLPYIRSCVYAAAGVSGLPVMRALFLEEPADARAWAAPAVDDEYFFGAAFLVAPIVEAGGVRSVYFPGDEGAAYLEYGNKTDVYRGGETADFTLGVHEVPVFVRAGAIVPRGDVFRANDRWTVDWAPYLDVEVFPSWGVPRSEFAYFNKEKGEVVDIALTTDEGKREVRVKYGEVGFNGSIVVYTKDGAKKVDLVAEGGEAVVEGVRSLFEV